jgi:hypothetical protein
LRYNSNIIELGTRQRSVVSFTLRPLYYPGKNPLSPFDRRLDGPQKRFGRYGEEKNLLLLPGIKPRPSSPYPVAIPTELLRLTAVCDIVMNNELEKMEGSGCGLIKVL